ncbi:MAG: YjbQ family protein [Erysipelotrichia bacterium]|nr:YjbQ family protein [Erysipelotrichia bacterium]
MKVFSEKLTLTSVSQRPTYHEITDKVREAIKKSGINDGICVVTTPHTTCSVIFEEYSHDVNYYGEEFLQIDLNNVMDKLVPVCKTEGQYYHPGPEHAKFAEVDMNAHRMYTLNTDAHLRASFFGNSQTFAVNDGRLEVGLVGYIYFVDWDQQRVRDRTCFVQIIGK